MAVAVMLCVAPVVALFAGAYSTAFVNVSASAGTENLGGVGDPLHPPRFDPSNETWAHYVGRVQMWGGVAIDDFDRDGRPDIYLTNDGANVLYRNDGNMTFTEVAAAAGVAAGGRSMGAAFGDFDNDGCRDLFVADFTGPSSLFRSNCDGTFSNVTGAAGISINMKAAGVAWGDYDRDGYLDLAVACYTACSNVLLHNLGNGTFAEATASAGVRDPGYTFQPAWVDYDHDGRLDLWDVNDFGPDLLFRNNGDGTFADVSKVEGIDREGGGGMGFAAGDIDGDGRMDYFVTNFYNDSLYRDTGAGLDESFVGSPINDFWIGWGANFFDAENDGDVDLYVANGFIFEQVHPEFLDDKFFVNDGRGQFSNASGDLDAAYGGVSHGSAAADFDGDGDLDLFVYNLSGPSMLLRNDGAKGSWLRVDLEGTLSNRDAVGALVTVEFNGRQATRLLMAGDSYLSQSQHTLHFGLGNATTADRLVIEWPSGAHEVLTNVSTNQTLNVSEPPSLIARVPGDYRVRPGQVFELNASTTIDTADGSFPAGANFTWAIDMGASTSTLYGPTAQAALPSSGTFHAVLTVRDSAGNQDEERFLVIVEDVTPPLADAGADQSVCDNRAVHLSAAGSTDNDPSFVLLATYQWTEVGPGSVYQGQEVDVPALRAGAHQFQLTATDPTGNVGQDSMTVQVSDCSPPVITMPASARAVEGSAVVVSPSVQEYAGANYSWSYVEGGQPRTAYGPQFEHTFSAPGTYALTLTVRDAVGLSSSANCIVEVLDTTAPAVSLPAQFAAPQGVPYFLAAEALSDNDPTFPATATFTWNVTGPIAPGGPAALQLLGPTPRLTFTHPGRFPIDLQVSDRAGNRASASSVVVVNDTTAPVLTAHKEVHATEGDMISLESMADDDDPHFALPGSARYVWQFEYGGQPVTLEGSRVIFTFDRPGAYRVTLTVFDAAGNAASDDFTVFVAAKGPDAGAVAQRVAVAATITVAALACVPFWRRAASPPRGRR